MSDREEFQTARDAGLKARHETRLARADLVIVKKALEQLPGACQYHGSAIVRDYGMWRGEACCETGAPALARRDAEAALARLEAQA